MDKYDAQTVEDAQPDVEFPRGQVSSEIQRAREEVNELHNNLDVLDMRLRGGGILRSDPKDNPAENDKAELREIKVPLAESLEEINNEIERAIRRLRGTIESVEL